MSFSYGSTGAGGGGFGGAGTGAFGSTGGGFGAAPAAGGAAASPFGGGATGGFGAAGTSAFGGGATGGFGSGIKPAATGFVTSAGFGSSTTAGGGMFGSQPAATGGFGAAPATGGTGLFGSAASPGGGFGAAAASPTGFGAANPTGGFGASGGAFGGGATGGFGAATGTNAFGSAAASPFGAPKPAAASPFGQSSGFGATSAFGGGGATGFGTPAPATGGGGVFGGGAAGTSAFGAKSPSPFGAAATTSAFGAPAASTGGFGGFGASPVAAQPAAQPQVGTGNPPYEVSREQDGTAGMTSFFAISRMAAYAHKSLEELRWEDYVKRTNPAQAQAIAALNQPQQAAASGFGATTGAAQPAATGFGATGFGAAPSAFGAAPAAAGGFGSSFGSNPTTATSSGFGSFGAQPATSGSMFGSTTRSLGFGTTTSTQPATSAFGTQQAQTGFGAPAAGGFGSTGSSFGSSFGAPAAATTQSATTGFGGFGSTTTGATGGFGAITGGAFGKPAGTTGGFGFGTTPTQAAPATGGFFSQNTGAVQQPAGGSLFGGSNPAATGSGFSFGATAPKPAGSTGFGGFGTTTTTPSAGGFGTGGGFGATGGFGSATGGFGASAATAQPAGGTSLFGGANTGTSGGFGFGTNTTTPTGGTSLFSSAPKTGTGMFGSGPTTGGSGMFGSATTGGNSFFGGGAATANKGASGFNFGGGSGLTGTTGAGGFGGGFGSFGSNTTTAPSTGGFGGSLFGGASAIPAVTAATAQPQQPLMMMAAPDVNPYGTGAFGAGLVEQNVKAALDSQSLKPSSTAASRLSTFAQDVGLPRGPLENSVVSKRNLLSSNRYSIPVSFIRESGFKGTKSRFATITSASAAAGSGNALRSSSTDAMAGPHDDEFKFSSSLFRNSVAKRLVISKTDLRHDSSSARHGNNTRASVIPLAEDETASSVGTSANRCKVPLKPDDEGYYSIVFRTMANKKSFTLRLKRTDTVKEARDDVRRLLRATMNSPVSDIQLLSNGRVVNGSTVIENLNLREGDVVDVAIVEDLTDGNAADRDQPVTSKKPLSGASDSVSKPQPSRFMSYAEFMNSAMREEQEQLLSELHKPVSTACPTLKNEDYYTVPSYDRLKSMTDDELAAVEGFTVGCKGLGSVEWIGQTDVRHLELDELIHFEKKEVIVYKDDVNKHELGTGLNRPAIVELLGIFAPRKVQDPEAYKEKVKLRTRDIGATYIDYTPSTGIWRFRVEHFSRYGFDDDDDDEDMDKTVDPSITAAFGGDKKKMAVPKRPHPVASARGYMSSDRVSLVRNSGMYRNASQFSGRSAAVSSFRDQGDEHMIEDSQLNGAVEPVAELVDQAVDEEDETLRVVHHVPTSIVFPVAPELLNLQPLGIDTQTSLLPHASKSTTYQLYLQVANQSVVAKNAADPGLFLSRSFRCSWGPNGELVNIGRPRTVSSGPAVGRTVTVEFPLVQRGASPIALNKEALELHYECCQLNSDDSEPEAPVRAFALPSDDGVVQCLRKYAEFADQTRKQYPSSRFHQRTALLWKLVQALWGQEHDVAELNTSQFCPLAARDDPREVESMETFQMVDLRREAISKWFEEALGVEVGRHDREMESASEAGVLKLLCKHRIVEAAEMAMECGDFRLSTLISQAASYEGSDFRTLLADQLSQWSENSTLEYVEEDIVMVYSLLAGSVEVLTSKKAADMSWLMCLALFFWYKRGPATSLKTALTLYREAVANSRAKNPAADSAHDVTKDDVLMEVMKLYVEEAVSLCSVLSPSGFPVESHGDKHLDYELSWHLHSVLRAIGFRIERKWESHIHHNYIRQLEGAGLWEEAIYVSLNISDAVERASTCRELLQRNADLLRTAPAAKRVELCDKYALPMEWLEEALAVVAVSKHQYYEEIAHWMAARQYEEAHACLIRHIAPTCLFSGEKAVLLQLLVELEPHATEISQWTACGTNYFVGGGRLVLEYLRLEGQQGIEPGGEVDFLDRVMDLAETLALARGSLDASFDLETAGSAQAQHQRTASELLVARTALSSMLVALATRAIQLRAVLDKLEDDQDDGEQSQTSSSTTSLLPFQLQPDFLTSLSAMARGRETKFVESYRATHVLRLCSAFVDWRS